MKNITTWIVLLPIGIQRMIFVDLISQADAYLTWENIERGMASRLCDLEDTIDLEKYRRILPYL